jgi:hypothetical protein
LLQIFSSAKQEIRLFAKSTYAGRLQRKGKRIGRIVTQNNGRSNTECKKYDIVKQQ